MVGFLPINFISVSLSPHFIVLLGHIFSTNQLLVITLTLVLMGVEIVLF